MDITLLYVIESRWNIRDTCANDEGPVERPTEEVETIKNRKLVMVPWYKCITCSVIDHLKFDAFRSFNSLGNTKPLRRVLKTSNLSLCF